MYWIRAERTFQGKNQVLFLSRHRKGRFKPMEDNRSMIRIFYTLEQAQLTLKNFEFCHSGLYDKIEIKKFGDADS